MSNLTVSEVREHLQWAADVELYTLPLYLSAAYSIHNESGETPTNDPNATVGSAQWAFTVIYSVCIQEMLHLHLVSNVAAALGKKIALNVNGTIPDYSLGYIPHIVAGLPQEYKPEADIGSFRVELGPLNMNQIELFRAIEVPTQYTNPVGGEGKYESIGEFYNALLDGIAANWSELFPHETAGAGQLGQYDYKSFSSDVFDVPGADPVPNYIFQNDNNTGNSDLAKEYVADMLDAIIVQGEGGPDMAGLAHRKLGVRVPEKPRVVPMPFALPPPPRGLDDQSHWARFTELKSYVEGLSGSVYPGGGGGATAEQAALNTAYTGLLNELTQSYVDAPTSGDAPKEGPTVNSMWAIGPAIAAVWKAGATPEWTYGS